MFYLEISISISVYSVTRFISELNRAIPFKAYKYCVDIGPYQKEKQLIGFYSLSTCKILSARFNGIHKCREGLKERGKWRTERWRVS
jgi:hypothetical protein